MGTQPLDRLGAESEVERASLRPYGGNPAIAAENESTLVPCILSIAFALTRFLDFQVPLFPGFSGSP
jgi:hypothetical protein